MSRSDTTTSTGNTSRSQAALRGFLFGLPWMAIGMCWMWFLTVPGYVLASVAFAGFHAAAAAAVPIGPWRTIGRPAAHTLVETIRLGFPFGGVPLATMGFDHAGIVNAMMPAEPHPGEDHRIAHYIALLEQAEAAAMRDGTL